MDEYTPPGIQSRLDELNCRREMLQKILIVYIIDVNAMLLEVLKDRLIRS